MEKITAESITAGIDLTNQRAVVTGASSGLGRECARVLALRGAQVGLLCRNLERGAATVAAFGQEAGPAVAARCDVLECDLARMDSVRAMATGLIAARRRIDLLMLNAGIFNRPYELTPDRVEATYASNYLGHFLLLHLLAEAGALAPNARIVTTQTSAVHSNPFAKADMQLLTAPAQHAARFSRLQASPGSKVMLAQAALEFTRRRVGTPLAAVAWVGASPGGVRTPGVSAVMGPLQRHLLLPLLNAFLRPVTEGAAALLWAATAEAAGRASGSVFDRNFQAVKLTRAAADGAAAQHLWAQTERLLELQPWGDVAA